MKTKNGSKILLDIERVLDAFPIRKDMAILVPIFLMIWLFSPIIILFGESGGRHIGWRAFFYSLGFVSVLAVFYRLLLLKLRHPMSLQLISQTFISPITMLWSSYFWFLNMSGVSYLDVWFIPVVWVLVEINAYYISCKNSDADLIAYFRTRFRKGKNDSYLFFHEPNFMQKIKGTRHITRWLYWLENGGGILIMIVGPAFFITSAALRDNFDPRFAIAGGILFFLGIGMRYVSTEFYTLRRGLKLKQEGRF